MEAVVSADAFRRSLDELAVRYIGLEVRALPDDRVLLRQMRPQRDIQRERFISARVRRPGRCEVVFDHAVHGAPPTSGDLVLYGDNDGSLTLRWVEGETRLAPLPRNFMQLQPDALMEAEVELYYERDVHGGTRRVWLLLETDGRLILRGEDTGPLVAQFFNSLDYEWAWGLEPYQVPRLLSALGLEGLTIARGHVPVKPDSERFLTAVRRRLLELARDDVQKQFEAAGGDFSRW